MTDRWRDRASETQDRLRVAEALITDARAASARDLEAKRAAEATTLELRGKLEIALQRKESAEDRAAYGEQAQLIEWQKVKLSEMSKEMHDLRTMYTTEHDDLRKAQKDLAKLRDERGKLQAANDTARSGLAELSAGRARDVVEHERLTRMLASAQHHNGSLMRKHDAIRNLIDGDE